jgi:hypothetical protein
VLKTPLIEWQRVNDVLMFDSGERLCEYVSELFVGRNVFDFECSSFVIL